MNLEIGMFLLTVQKACKMVDMTCTGQAAHLEAGALWLYHVQGLEP